jgi:F-type H+-transporting ATPase subunit b
MISNISRKIFSRLVRRLRALAGPAFAVAVLSMALTIGGGARAEAAEEGHGNVPTPDVAAEHGAAHGEHGAGAHGAEHEPEIDGKKLGLQIFNFAVLVGILVFFGGKAVNKALRGRHEQLKADLASAAEARAAAEAKLAKQEARLGSLETEIAELRRNLKAEAEAEKARLIEAAEERATRIKAETTFLIDQQVREADQRLRRESADAALKIAEDILRRSIGPADQQRLLETFVGNVAGAPAGTPSSPAAPSGPAGRAS